MPGRIAERRSRAGERAADRVVRSAAQQVEAGGSGVDVRAGHPERVIVVPHRRRPLVVVVLEDRASRRPRLAEQPLSLAPEALVEGAGARESRRDVPGRRRQVPGLGVAVALLRGVPAVQVGDDRHRARVRGGIGAVRVRPRRTSRRVRPVQRLVDRKKMRQVVPVRVHELVDPLDAHRSPPARLDRERGVVEAAWVVDRAVAPDRRRLQTHALRQDVLPELPNGDLVVVDALHGRRRGGARHRRRDHERRHVLRDAGRRERPARHLCERLPRADAERQEQDRAARSAVLEQLSTRDPSHLYLLVTAGDAFNLGTGAACAVGDLTSRTPAHPRRRHSREHAVLPVGVGSLEQRGADAARATSGLFRYSVPHRPSPPIRFDHSSQQHVNAVMLMRHVCHTERRR